MRDPKEVMESMGPPATWLIKVGRAASIKSRTTDQKIWDSAILTAGEFIRRLDNYDESRCTALAELLSTNLPESPTQKKD